VIPLILCLLIVYILSPPSLVQAAAPSIQIGAQTWEYSEFTKAFREYLRGDDSPIINHLFLALGLGLIALTIFELSRRRLKSNSPSEPSPSSDDSAETVQRRAWARIESSLHCRFIITHPRQSSAADSEFADADEEELEGLIVDLSGGGCKIATAHPLQVGDELELFLELEPRNRLVIRGEVARTESGTDTDQIFAGVKFSKIRESVRDQIISWMFKHQQTILEGQRRLAEGLCLRCGKPLSEVMRQQSVFCSKCSRLQNDGYRR
jgi:Tfp pilus assembly protein PilZ